MLSPQRARGELLPAERFERALGPGATTPGNRRAKRPTAGDRAAVFTPLRTKIKLFF